MSNKAKQYVKWSIEEQEKFREIVEELKNSGEKYNWKDISAEMITKNPRQCYDYYLVHKDKEQTKRHVWTKEEEELLSTAANQTNKNWSEIERSYFQDFSVSQLRNKYNHMISGRVESSISSATSSIMSEMSEIPSCLTEDPLESKEPMIPSFGGQVHQQLPFVAYAEPPKIDDQLLFGPSPRLEMGKFTIYQDEKNDEEISFGYPFDEE